VFPATANPTCLVRRTRTCVMSASLPTTERGAAVHVVNKNRSKIFFHTHFCATKIFFFLKKNIPSVLSLLCHKKFLLKKKYIPSVLS